MISLIYFSPTGSTRQVIENVASGFLNVDDFNELDVQRINLLKKKVRESDIEVKGDICIVGAPCYEARIPPIVREVLRKINGKGIPTLAVVVYGNRTIGISIKQLVSILNESNFKVLGTGTFIAEHAYADLDIPISFGRPNFNDIKDAHKFGQALSLKISDVDNLDIIKGADVHGKINPLFKLLPEGFLAKFTKPSAVDQSKCIKCGLCKKICPTNSITESDGQYLINFDECIRCMACVKVCVVEARVIDYKFKPIIKWFMKSAIQKERDNRWEVSSF